MNLVRFSINKPVTVIVGVILVVLFGIIGLTRLPYQLSPTVIEPEITVTTHWVGATPYEIERDIIEEQENTLKGIPGLIEMESDSLNGRGSITLRFAIGTDVDDALLRVSNKLNEVRSYPETADKPIINATGAATSPVIWVVMKALEGNEREIDTYLTYFENEIRQHLERVEGVAEVWVPGGRLEELHVVVKPERLAAYGLTINDMINALRAENANVSAGVMGVGRRDFRIRTTGEFSSIEDIESLVIRSTGQKRVMFSEVAEVKNGYRKRTATILHNGRSGMAMGIKPEPGTNVLEMTNRTQKVVDWLNEEKLKPIGVYMDWVYDQRHYINGAIDLIKKNIAIGGCFAIIVLLLFLRSVRSTLVVATSIPISVIGTFIFMDGFGRNLNVVSLSGIAFAVGMLVDNAIVVIENIDRHRKMGKTPFDAAYDGTAEVWSAVFASTLTTIAVFLPVVFLKEEAGQLFRDIALAVVSAVSLSLVVAVTVIPMFSKQMFSLTEKRGAKKRGMAGGIGEKLSGAMMSVVSLAIGNWATRIVTVSLLISLAVGTALVLKPKMEYLPQGNRNFVLTFLVPPPGLSVEERHAIGEDLFEYAAPYFDKDHEGFPAIKNMFYVGSERIMIFGALAKDWARARELVPLFTRMIYTIPGMYGVSIQPGIFQTRLARGRTIDVDISGDDVNALVRTAGMMFGKLRGIGFQRIRPVPSIELLYPEVRILPDRDRLRANNMSANDLGIAIDVLMDGRDIGDYKQEGRKKVDLVLMSSDETIRTPEELYSSLVATPGGKVLPVSSLGRLERTYGITQIRHLERTRTVTLQITPAEDLPLQSAMEQIESKVFEPLEKAGAFKGANVRMSGAANKLVETRKALQWNFVLAALIAYLLMAALFGNFIYPLVIMFTVPLAGAGGFAGLRLLDLLSAGPQPMDIVTMLGFVILIGIVVNNAILIVHQALNNVRLHSMDYREAVTESVRVRLRPIYMSAFTSIFGMLPLVLFPGAGSELYRGLGSVILGGIAVSTIFTVFVIPSLLMFVIRMEHVKKTTEVSQ